MMYSTLQSQGKYMCLYVAFFLPEGNMFLAKFFMGLANLHQYWFGARETP